MFLYDSYSLVCILSELGKVSQVKLIKNTIEKAITEPISVAGGRNSLVFAVKAVKKGRRLRTRQTLLLACSLTSPLEEL
jgi:hypothetical protein